jgi:pimeloyl-ACP methyl ester carboxylesterase
MEISEQAVTLHTPEGYFIPAILATPHTMATNSPPAVVVLCHGFLSNKNSTTNLTLTRLMTERGLATLRFDFLGQGQSPDQFENLTLTIALSQASTVLDWATAQGFTRVGLIGSSFGGLVAVLTAAQRPTVTCLGLKCPVGDFPEELRLEFGEAEMATWKATDTVRDIHGGTGRVPLKFALYEDCLGYDAYEAAERITAPTVIVQGGKDEYVPAHQSRRVFQALAGRKRFDLLPHANHQFTQADDFSTMTASLTQWMADHLLSLPATEAAGA